MLDKLNTWLLRVFCIFWMLFVLLDYLNYSSYFNNAVANTEYLGFLIFSIGIMVGLTLVFGKRIGSGLKFQIKNFRNIYLYGLILIFMVLIMIIYIQKTNIIANTGPAIIQFIMKSLGFHLALGLILTAAYNSGSSLVNRLPLNISVYSKPLISLAVGFAFVVFGLLILGALGLLNQIATLILILGCIAIGWRNIITLFKRLIFVKSKVFEIHLLSIFSLYVILVFIAISLISVIRPLPIGFDALTLYMNTPKLIAGYEALTEGGQAYNWSLIMSLGFILFKNTALAISLSVLPGILSLIVLYRIAVNFVTRDWAIFVCAVFYTFPNIIFQSRYEAKVDFAMLFIILCCVLLVVEHYFRKIKKPAKQKLAPFKIDPNIALWALCGLLFGFAFGIKYTAVFSIFGFLVLNFYIIESKWSAIAIFFINFSVIFGLGLTKFSNVEVSPDKMSLLVGLPAIIGLGFLAPAIKNNRKNFFEGVKRAAIFGCVIAITFIPWAVKNISENGKFSIEALITGKNPLKPLKFSDAGLENIKNEKKLVLRNEDSKEKPSVLFASIGLEQITYQSDKNLIAQAETKVTNQAKKKKAVNTAKYEEVNRYIGYEKGVIKFLSLPYDLTMKRNVNLWTVDFGLIFFLLIPLFMLSFKEKQLHWNLLKILFLLLILIASMLSVAYQTGDFNLQTSIDALQSKTFLESVFYQNWLKPIYILFSKALLFLGASILPFYHLLTLQSPEISFIIIILSSALVFLMFWPIIKNVSKKLKLIIAFIYTSTVLWLVLASGILWYGFVGFSLLPLIAAIFLDKNEKGFLGTDKIVRTAAICGCGIYFILITLFQLVPIHMTMGGLKLPDVNFTTIFTPAFAQYSINEIKEKDALKSFYGKAENNIITVLNKDKEAKIINVYASLKYHISNNDKRLYDDNLLDLFNRIYVRENGDRDKVTKGIKDTGVKYILISFATPNMDNTPEKSLTTKYNNLLNTLVNNPGARLLHTNRLVERPDGDFEVTRNGKKVKAKYGLAGISLIEGGTMALYEIL